ncbi:hypothetical protein MLP_27030 [Microlunatus phosphovorus NM-1]|uniref:Uncharacterized protein n=1 Tax=Microlunatus phosphovorus (strain ATCC 700054 / DSM 10555 / JCM 9379 / NBRC 101784 / NCIMB 13414 / VKM Ac-1990 / NM-1) TaxID=1032480 RepID=F5XI48_MICPN|nr:hypothetical protein MLP_27030 [Microlunatus phosphovorus NM-1]
MPSDPPAQTLQQPAQGRVELVADAATASRHDLGQGHHGIDRRRLAGVQRQILERNHRLMGRHQRGQPLSGRLRRLWSPILGSAGQADPAQIAVFHRHHPSQPRSPSLGPPVSITRSRSLGLDPWL